MSFEGYSYKMDHGHNGPDKTDHLSGQNGPRLETKRTLSQDKMDHVPGQNGPGFRTKRATFLDKRGPVLGQSGPCKKIHDVLQKKNTKKIKIFI